MDRRIAFAGGVRLVTSLAATIILAASGFEASASAQDSSPLATHAVASLAPNDDLAGTWQTPPLTTTQVEGALRKAGLPDDGIAKFLMDAGLSDPIVWSEQFDEGRYVLQLTAGHGVPATMDQGSYEIVDDDTLVETNDCCVIKFDYSVSGDTLNLRQVDQTNGSSDDDYYGIAIFGVAPFQRVVENAGPTLAPASPPSQGSAAGDSSAATADWPFFRGDAARRGEGTEGPVGQPVQRWRFQAQGAIGGNVSIVGDLVYASSDDGVLHALDLASGTERWQFTPDHTPISGPAVADGVVYVFDGLGTLFALDAATGEDRWHSEGPLEGPASPTVLDGALYVGTADGALVAIDTASGAELWRYIVSPDGGGVHGPAISDGIVYAGSDAGGLVAVDAASGELVWHHDTATDQTATAVVADGIAYIGAGGDATTGHLWALDAQGGALLWEVNGPIFAPSVSDGVAFSGSPSGLVTAHDTATGAEVWHFQVEGAARGSSVANGVVYVPADDEHRVYALDAATGAEVWHFDVDGALDSGIAVAHGSVFVGTLMGGVYAIGGDGSTAATPLISPTAAPAQSQAPTTSAPGPSSVVASQPFSGTWQTAPVTQADLEARGLAADAVAGFYADQVFTLRLDDGRYTSFATPAGGVMEQLDQGTYTVDPTEFVTTSSGGAPTFLDWHLDDGALYFTVDQEKTLAAYPDLPDRPIIIDIVRGLYETQPYRPTDPAAQPPTAESLPDGTYQTATLPAATIKEAIAAAGFDPTWFDENWPGAETLAFQVSFDSGYLTESDIVDGGPVSIGWRGRYLLEDDHTILATAAETGYSAVITYAFELDGDVLRLKLLSDTDQRDGELTAQTTIYDTAPFTRVP